jgi:hypothetical protein
MSKYFDSWSESPLQDLLIDVATVVDATECDGTLKPDILGRPRGNLDRVPDVVNSGNNLTKAMVWKDGTHLKIKGEK